MERDRLPKTVQDGAKLNIVRLEKQLGAIDKKVFGLDLVGVSMQRTILITYLGKDI